DAFLGSSAALRRHLRGIRRAAASRAPILILGDAGTGRSTLVRAVHLSSLYRDGPFVELDAAAVPTSLFEGDLFGHEAGAFTGAEQRNPGRVARAQGGTLVLDHVEELPLAVQPKLLRLIAERRFTPLGGEETVAEVRFIATSLEDLARRVQRGAFRQDLYYRLEVLAFRLPRLCDRIEDLPRLVASILGDLGERFERPGLEISPGALQWMSRYSWPGNVRQLRNLLERTLVLSDDPILDPAPPQEGGRPDTLAEVERRHLIRALAFARGNQTRAAEVLGISRKALWEKRRRFGLP
ncbi:MAG: sigma-54-dependent Fis family transcriptional regulator, partial [Acidobacteria bacterium]|nr:sigma-54-dependent Fis family transcriptional regulator [Acidobacteriota bacterium]